LNRVIDDEGEASYLAEGLADHGVRRLEEPIDPENRAGYIRLSKRSRVPLAAGESEFTAHDFTDLIAAEAIQYAQPDVTRSGGISETRRIASLADAFRIRYAPHVGHSGIVCIAASLDLAAAAPNTYAYEWMVTPERISKGARPQPGWSLLASRKGRGRDTSGARARNRDGLEGGRPPRGTIDRAGAGLVRVPIVDSVFHLSPHRAKDRDKELIFATIQQNGPISQKRILEELKIRPTALSKSIQELVEDCLIVQRP